MFSNISKKYNIKSYTIIKYKFLYDNKQKKYDNFQHLRIFFNISSNTSCIFLIYIIVVFLIYEYLTIK